MTRPDSIPRVHCWLLVVILACSAALSLTSPASAVHELDALACVDTITGFSPRPDARTDGTTVVWSSYTHVQEQVFEDQAIMAANLADRQPFVVATRPDSGAGSGAMLLTDPDVDGDLVVWTFSGDIYGKHLSGGDPFLIAATDAYEYHPRVEGSWISWVSDTNNTTTIMIQRLVGRDEPVPVASAPFTGGSTSIYGPELDSGRVYWGVSQADFSVKLYSAALSDAPAIVDEELPWGPIDAGRLMPIVGAGATDTGSQATVIDLETGATRTVALEFGRPVSVSGIAITGRYLIISAVLSHVGPGGGEYRLYGYDLETDSWFAIMDSPSIAFQAEGGAFAWANGSTLLGYCAGAAHLSDVLPSAPRPDPQSDVTWFSQTGHTLGGTFAGYWEGSGGLPVFGYPLTEEFQEQNPDTGAFYATQYFERERFELHPEHAGTVYEVLLGRLGAQLLDIQGRDWQDFPTADPSAPHYFAATGHAIAPQFYGYWSTHGLEFGDAGVSEREALALFGYPISEPMLETNADDDTVLTQYFERAVFEHHPENAGTAHDVLLRRVGFEMLVAREWMAPLPSDVMSSGRFTP